MEEKEQQAARFALIRTAMPKTTELVAQRRRELGDDHVTECIRRGMAGQPGYFFAREGGLAVGTPWDDFATTWADSARVSQVLVVLREGAIDGAH